MNGIPAFGQANFWRTAELLEQGFNARAISALVRGGQLVRIRRGCYARGDWWNGLTEPDRRRQRVYGHAHGTLTTSAGSFVYSHTSAAALRRLHLWNVDETVHLTQPGRPSGISHGYGVAAHTGTINRRELSLVDGLPCTSLERTVVDSCLMFNVRQAVILVDHAARLGADVPLLRERCAALAGRNGAVALRTALELVDPRSESAGESLTRELIHRLKLPTPELQFSVYTASGPYRLDFAWPARKVALEFDGKSKYFDFHPTDEVIYNERQREKALTEDGWIVLRIEWKHLFSEAEFKYRVLRAFARNCET